MSKHFSLLDFLRRAPKHLLQSYCHRRGILQGFNWGKGKRPDAEAIARALENEGVISTATVDFRAIWDHQGSGFTKGILNEAQYHRDEAAYELLRNMNGLGKAFWATLEQPVWAANAKILSDVDKLPEGAWIKRVGLPARPGPVDAAVVEQFESGLIAYFTSKQHRGRHCKIDCLRRGAEEVFFTWVEDHPDSDLLWHDGQLKPQTLNGSFRLIFKHDDARRTLEIFIEGDRDIVPHLQCIFAQCVIGEEIEPESPGDKVVYAIDRLLEPGFQFDYPSELGISNVRVTKMRFCLEGKPWRRFMAEANAATEPDALSSFVASLTQQLPKSRLNLDQVCINVVFHKRDGDRRARSRTFFITSPNSLRLKKDDLGEKIAEMLICSKIERTSDSQL